MRRSTKCMMLVLGALWLAAAAQTGTAQAVRIEPRIPLSVEQRARLQAVADDGADALRRYLWRTRMIYNWRWHDLVGGS
jgi:hypothetical protein